MSERPAAKPQRQQADDRRVSAFERLTSGGGGIGDSGQVLQAPRRGGSGRDGGRGAGRDGGSRRGGGRGGRGQVLLCWPLCCLVTLTLLDQVLRRYACSWGSARFAAPVRH